ncbi:tetratricopeptide repeat protein [Winogradskyella sp.]|uniref:tetratricopeptide repeat protein n=1 Tax=Winogradskyella sp. TaxID=1883156 RepID=UPI003BA96CB7
MNLIRLLSFSFFILLGFESISQTSTPKIDSLKLVLKQANSQRGKAKAYADICWEYLNTDLKIAKKYNDSSKIFYESINHEKGVSNCVYRYGVIYRKSGDYNKALVNFNDVLKYATTTKDTFTVADCSYQKGVVYASKGDFEKSLQEYYRSIELYESLNDLKSVGMVLNSVGIVQKNLKDYPKAIESYERVIDIYNETNYTNGLSNAYGNLGNVYAITGNYDKAIACFRNSLKIDEQNQNNWGIAINKMDMARLYVLQNENTEAIGLYEQALAIQIKHNFKKEQVETLTNLGEAYRFAKNYEKSEYYLKEALKKNIQSKAIRQYINEQLFLLYQDKKDYKLALDSYKVANELKDSIYQQKNLKSINDLQIKYDSKVKDEEIANQKLVLNEKEKDFQLAILGSSLLLITSLGIWLFYRQKQKLKNKEIETLVAQKELSKLEALIAGEENERKRIAQDLHDGINGDLSVIKYKMTSIDQNRFKPKEEEAFSMAIDMLDNAIDQVRHISHNLVPPSLQNFNLIEALQQFSSKISSTKAIKINFQQYGEYLKLNKDAETAIYRIIQELITNSVKHSEATKALVQINSHDENLHITVEDNGIGFDTTKTYKGIGFKNIESRVALLNADFSVDSNSKGSTFTIDINTSELRDD